MVTPTTVINATIPIPITLIKNLLETDFDFEIQYFGLVKSGDGAIKKIHLAVSLYNNKSYRIIREVYLLLNDQTKLIPKQLIKYVGLQGAVPDKPFFKFIWDEKNTKELNIEFEAPNDKVITLDQNNNVKFVLTNDRNEQIKFQFGVMIDKQTLQVINDYDAKDRPVVFSCYSFKIGE